MADSTIYGLGDKLRQLRKKHKLTQKEVAEKVSVDPKSVSEYENDRLTPKTETLIQFAVIYNISLDYLVGIGKESHLYLHEFTDSQRDFILKTIEGIKNFNYEDTKTDD